MFPIYETLSQRSLLIFRCKITSYTRGTTVIFVFASLSIKGLILKIRISSQEKTFSFKSRLLLTGKQTGSH